MVLEFEYLWIMGRDAGGTWAHTLLQKINYEFWNIHNNSIPVFSFFNEWKCLLPASY